MPPCRIRTHNPSKLAAADPGLRPPDHWDQHFSFLTPIYSPKLFVLGHAQSVFSSQNRFCWQICFPIWGSTNKMLRYSSLVEVNSGWHAELNDSPPYPYECFPAVSLQQRGLLSSTTPLHALVQPLTSYHFQCQGHFSSSDTYLNILPPFPVNSHANK